MNKPKSIAHVKSRPPPKSLKTVEDWMAWRDAEDARMYVELLAQLEAHFERLIGKAVVH